MKTCKDCKRAKALKEFYPLSKGRVGVLSYCKICHNKRARANEKKRAESIEKNGRGEIRDLSELSWGVSTIYRMGSE